MIQSQDTFTNIVENKWKEYMPIYKEGSNSFLHLSMHSCKISDKLKKPLEFFLPISSGIEGIIAHISEIIPESRFKGFVKLKNNGFLIPNNLAENYNLQIDNTYQMPKEVRIYFP